MHNRIQSEFVNLAAHEFCMLVQPILGLADLFESQFDGGDKIEITKDDMALIVGNARRLERLTFDILEVTRIERGSIKLRKEALDLNTKVENVVKDANDTIPANKKNAVQILIETAPYPLTVDAGMSRIYEVMSNLLGNAIKFTDERRIVISTEMGHEDGRQYAIVTIRDAGTGIDPEIMPRLFTKFASKSAGIRSFVEAHSGSIWGEYNKERRGATFGFTLPLSV